MNRLVTTRAVLIGSTLVLAAILGCAGPHPLIEPSNLLPIVRITEAPLDTTVQCPATLGPDCYSLELRWTGFDPDGRVERFRYCIDPPSLAGADTAWQTTTRYELDVKLSAEHFIPGSGTPPFVRGHHVFVIAAVDDRGAVGPRLWRAFFSYTQAPDVYITSPTPSLLAMPLVPPTVRIHWQGQDYDAIGNERPIAYRWILLGEGDEIRPLDVAQDPEILLRRYGPAFAEWHLVPGTVTSVSLTNLVPEHEYLFAVVAFDEAGAFSPVFRLESNLLRFRVRIANGYGPTITAYSDFFQYTWRPSNCVCPANELYLEVPPRRSIRFEWTALPPAGADMHSYRWAFDIEDLMDDTPREDESTDIKRWSTPALNVANATVGPFEGALGGAEEHRLYVQARDNLGFQSLAIIRFRVAAPNPRPGSMLIVRDTRLRADQLDRATNCAQRPLGPWPTQAELDTFLFARGGARWRCYPTGTITTPGLFAGYDFDTLSTRFRRVDMSVPLTTLLDHEYVVWIVDAKGALWTAAGDDAFEPTTSLRYMNDTRTERRMNTVAEFVRLGGKLWIAGGGAGTATLHPFDNRTNNSPTLIFSSQGSNPELVPPRFLVEYARWKSEMRISSEPALVRRFAGRLDARPEPQRPYTQRLSELPATLDMKTMATDPMPPNRTNRGEFYPVVVPLEYLQRPNPITEVMASGDTVTTLDTLYKASGGAMPLPLENPHNVVMTYYHGPKAPQGLVYSGFDLWSFRRTQCQSLVDFVLQRIWGLQRRPTATVAASDLSSGPAAESRRRAERESPASRDRRTLRDAPPARRR